MDNSDLQMPSKKLGGIRIYVSLLILVVGILIGALGAKSMAHSSSNPASPMASATPAAARLGAPQSASQIEVLDPLVQIRNMQAEVDQIFQRSFADFHLNPQLKVFQLDPGYSLSMDVRDLKDRYQVRAYLPDSKASDVKVNLDGNQLKVQVTNKTTEKEMAKHGEEAASTWGQYEEVVQLAGPLHQDRMQVQRQGHELLITVPKSA